MARKERPGRAKDKSTASARGARRKGARFELDTAKMLHVWWGGDPGTPAKEMLFRRSPGSGGVDPDAWPGDVIPSRAVEAEWPVVIECKANDSEFGDLIELLTAPGCAFFAWVEQAREAERLPGVWWLVVRRVFYPPLVVMESDLFSGFARNAGDGDPGILPVFHLETEEDTLTILPLGRFLAAHDPRRAGAWLRHESRKIARARRRPDL